MTEEEKTTTTETPEGLEDQSAAGRLFTQEEVNKIVKTRLAKVKEANQAAEDRVAEAVKEATAARLAELDARERRLDCRDFLIVQGYPEELLDALDTSDVEAFKNKARSLVGVLGKGRDVAPLGSGEATISGSFKKAFAQEQAHKPKGWPPIIE